MSEMNCSSSSTPLTLTMAASMGVLGKYFPRARSEIERASTVQTRPV